VVRVGGVPDATAEPRLRVGARAVILDPDDRILLLRVIAGDGTTVWLTPGGGIEPGESRMAALRRELAEEVGLRLTDDPPHLWHQRVVEPGHIDGYDGAINDFFLVRTEHFDPHGTMTPEQLRAELVHGHRWWSIDEIETYVGNGVFAPRELSDLLRRLLHEGPPASPVTIGL
jgi:8-oxo-dGTP pyrophosphatase MutT (NUDIX family)